MENKFLFVIFVSTISVACSHSTPKYQPEIDGKGKSFAVKGAVEYPIPPDHPVVHMKLVSIPAPKEHTLHVRMYFTLDSYASKQKITLDPSAQVFLLPDHGGEIKPSKVYASSKLKPAVDLASRPKQVVELVYSLPKGGDEYSYFQIRFTVKYGANKSETQVARFDRETHAATQSPAQAQHLEGDTYYDSLVEQGYQPEWVGDDWGWW